MKTSNFISLSLTGLAVKTYMLIGIVWSKSQELGKNMSATTQSSTTLSAASNQAAL